MACRTTEAAVEPIYISHQHVIRDWVTFLGALYEKISNCLLLKPDPSASEGLLIADSRPRAASLHHLDPVSGLEGNGYGTEDAVDWWHMQKLCYSCSSIYGQSSVSMTQNGHDSI